MRPPGGREAGRGPVAVVLASAGRPELLADAARDVVRQSAPGLTLVVSVPDDDSLPEQPLPRGTLVAKALGLAAQRNAGLDASTGARIVFFFDDDTVVRDDYVEAALRVFEAHPEVMGVTGRVLLDGAGGEPITRARAVQALAESPPGTRGRVKRTTGLYGCNFAVRVGEHGERFDDRLPLYSWFEDRDFSERLKRHGLLVRADDCVVVHRGVRSGGRMAHLRLGYSQIMNPAYLNRTGSFSLVMALKETLPRLGKNAMRSVVPREAGWRRRRLLGNLWAVADVLRGRFTPERITAIEP